MSKVNKPFNTCDKHPKICENCCEFGKAGCGLTRQILFINNRISLENNSILNLHKKLIN